MTIHWKGEAVLRCDRCHKEMSLESKWNGASFELKECQVLLHWSTAWQTTASEPSRKWHMCPDCGPKETWG